MFSPGPEILKLLSNIIQPLEGSGFLPAFVHTIHLIITMLNNVHGALNTDLNPDIWHYMAICVTRYYQEYLQSTIQQGMRTRNRRIT